MGADDWQVGIFLTLIIFCLEGVGDNLLSCLLFIYSTPLRALVSESRVVC